MLENHRKRDLELTSKEASTILPKARQQRAGNMSKALHWKQRKWVDNTQEFSLLLAKKKNKAGSAMSGTEYLTLRTSVMD